jgi:hypothetical protein
VTLDGIYRYVTYDRVPTFLSLGWVVAADLGPTHGRWSCLMRWLCECKAVVPKSATVGDT